jgi:hypothetical protein
VVSQVKVESFGDSVLNGVPDTLSHVPLRPCLFKLAWQYLRQVGAKGGA